MRREDGKREERENMAFGKKRSKWGKGRWKIAVGLLFVQPKLKRETAFENCLNPQSAISECLHTFSRIQRCGSKLI